VGKDKVQIKIFKSSLLNADELERTVNDFLEHNNRQVLDINSLTEEGHGGRKQLIIVIAYIV
jgi:hypothetical protein